MPTPRKPLPSQESLVRLLDYSVVTGHIYRRPEHARSCNNFPAGTITNAGYRCIRINNVRYLAHRLIWRMITGEDPGQFEIDHIDRDKDNNAWHNLRLATRNQNQCNIGLNPRSTSQLKGISFNKASGKWMARICFKGNRQCLGYFSTPEEAHDAYVIASGKIHREFSKVY